MPILQFNLEAGMVHSHSYTPTAGDIRDLTFDGRSFHVLLSDGSVDHIRMPAQAIGIGNRPTDFVEGHAIETMYRSERGSRHANRLSLGGDTGVFSSILGSYRFDGSAYQRIAPRYATSPIIFGGGTHNGRDLFFAFNREAASPGGIRRVVWARLANPNDQPKTLVNLDTGWGSFPDDYLRGFTFLGRDYFALFNDAGTIYLQHCRDIGHSGNAQDLRLRGQFDISAQIAGAAFGLCFDGKDLYVGDT